MSVYQLCFCSCAIALIRLILVGVASNLSTCIVILHVINQWGCGQLTSDRVTNRRGKTMPNPHNQMPS